MSPEIRVANEKVGKLLLGLNCPDIEKGCNGKIQTYEKVDGQTKVCCYSCGKEVDPETVKVIYEVKNPIEG